MMLQLVKKTETSIACEVKKVASGQFACCTLAFVYVPVRTN